MNSIKVVADEKDYLELHLEREDVGFTNLLVEKLLKDKDVSFAASAYDHPLRGNPVLKIKGKNPRKHLKEAIRATRKELESLQALLEKKLK